jgi:hypothetical protein
MLLGEGLEHRKDSITSSGVATINCGKIVGRDAGVKIYLLFSIEHRKNFTIFA